MAEPRLYFYFLSDPAVGYDFQKANATEAQIVKDAVLVSTPGDFVMRALFRVRETGGKIAQMVISGHGGPDVFRIGATSVNLDTIAAWTPVFSMLTPHFAENAVVTIQACDFARSTKLLTALSLIWGVRVQGWTGDIDVYKWWLFEGVAPEGDRIVCVHGMCHTEEVDADVDDHRTGVGLLLPHNPF